MELMQVEQYPQNQPEQTHIDDGIDHNSEEWLSQYADRGDINLDDCKVLRAPRQIFLDEEGIKYGTNLALNDLMETGEHTENWNIFNYVNSIKAGGIDITKPEGYQANGEPITEKTAADLLHSNPANPHDLEKLLNNFDEIHLKDGTIIWSESYFEEHIKPTLNKEELSQISCIDHEEIKELLLNQEQAIDLYNTADASEITSTPEYQQQFDEWAEHMEEEAEKEDKLTALEIALEEDREAEKESDFNLDLDIGA